MPRALLIIAQNGYQDIEYAGTRKGLEEGGFEVTVASAEKGECTGKLGGTVQAEMAIREAKAEDFECVAFIGGPGARALADDPAALQLATKATSCRVLGAICIAPLILAKAGVLSGKNATVWNEDGKQEALFTSLGIHYTGDPVTIDGTIVTANGPAAAEEFGRTVARLTVKA